MISDGNTVMKPRTGNESGSGLRFLSVEAYLFGNLMDHDFVTGQMSPDEPYLHLCLSHILRKFDLKRVFAWSERLETRITEQGELGKGPVNHALTIAIA